MNKIPTIKVFKSKNQSLTFFGVLFVIHFIHTVLVVAHCTNKNSPYYKTGYFLKEYNKKEIRELGLPIN